LAIITTFIGLVIGGYLVIVLIALGLLIITIYSGGPFPLKRFGLGEVAVFITWGPLMVGGAYFIVTGVFSWFVVTMLWNNLGYLWKAHRQDKI
jgi:1,4-dihydroxy-2-naphthoate octaprenyltransferase